MRSIPRNTRNFYFTDEVQWRTVLPKISSFTYAELFYPRIAKNRIAPWRKLLWGRSSAIRLLLAINIEDPVNY